jgi:hypothetical protein
MSGAEPRNEGVDDGAGQFEPDNEAAERLRQVSGLRVMIQERKDLRDEWDDDEEGRSQDYVLPTVGQLPHHVELTSVSAGLNDVVQQDRPQVAECTGLGPLWFRA